MTKVQYTDTIIIGASAAGLSCAVCLKQSGIPFILLEKNESVGSEWRNRYDRLHLHTTKTHSHLPYYKMPAHFPKYVPKHDFAEYLEQYAAKFGIPALFNHEVIRVEKQSDHWEASTTTENFVSKHVVVATGHAGIPVQALWHGMKDFKGEIIHSAEYRNGKRYQDKKVLVVGFGNSACEIAMCLHEHHAIPSLSVRSRVNILPREIAGISILNIAIAESWLIKISPAMTDAVNSPILKLINGNFEKYGLQKSPYGALTQITKYKKIPLLDIGTMKLIKQGKIKVYPGIKSVATDSVKFTDGREERFDVIISATGYVPAVARFIRNYEKVCDHDGIPLLNGKESAIPGLYFCGFKISPTGMLREIGIEAKGIAKHIAGHAASYHQK